MQELLWKTWRRNFCQPGRTAWYIFSIDLPWNYDKRYEVTSPISIEDNEEISNEIPFKVASISDTVLLVDDNIEILAYLQKELSRGFRILTAQNGREALEVLGKENVSLVVSDVMMPEMDGMELCMHIKDNPSFVTFRLYC